MIAQRGQRKPLLFAVTGEIGSGKTTFLIALDETARRAGLPCGGFVQKRVDDTGTRAKAYDLVRLQTGTTIRIATRDESGKFVFDDQGFATAREWIIDELRAVKLIVIDEIGLLESADGGHAQTLVHLLEETTAPVVCLSLRASTAPQWIERLAIPSPNVLDLRTQSSKRESFLNQILRSAQSL